MASYFAASLRTARATALVTDLGANPIIELWDGTQPTNLGTPAGALKATLTGDTTLGPVSSGVITVSTYTQSNGSHVAGTPTFVRLKTSGGTVKADLSIGGGGITWTGVVAPGQNVTGSFTLTEGNATV